MAFIVYFELQQPLHILPSLANFFQEKKKPNDLSFHHITWEFSSVVRKKKIGIKFYKSKLKQKPIFEDKTEIC